MSYKRLKIGGEHRSTPISRSAFKQPVMKPQAYQDGGAAQDKTYVKQPDPRQQQSIQDYQRQNPYWNDSRFNPSSFDRISNQIWQGAKLPYKAAGFDPDLIRTNPSKGIPQALSNTLIGEMVPKAVTKGINWLGQASDKLDNLIPGNFSSPGQYPMFNGNPALGEKVGTYGEVAELRDPYAKWRGKLPPEKLKDFTMQKSSASNDAARREIPGYPEFNSEGQLQRTYGHTPGVKNSGSADMSYSDWMNSQRIRLTHGEQQPLSQTPHAQQYAQYDPGMRQQVARAGPYKLQFERPEEWDYDKTFPPYKFDTPKETPRKDFPWEDKTSLANKIEGRTIYQELNKAKLNQEASMREPAANIYQEPPKDSPYPWMYKPLSNSPKTLFPYDYLPHQIGGQTGTLLRGSEFRNGGSNPFNGFTAGTGWLAQKGGISKTGYKQDSPDRFNDYNIIPSNQITMQGVNQPLYGQDNLGFSQAMYPGSDYMFPGSHVLEQPLMSSGGHPSQAKAAEMISNPPKNQPMTPKQVHYFQALAHGWNPKSIGGMTGPNHKEANKLFHHKEYYSIVEGEDGGQLPYAAKGGLGKIKHNRTYFEHPFIAEHGFPAGTLDLARDKERIESMTPEQMQMEQQGIPKQAWGGMGGLGDHIYPPNGMAYGGPCKECGGSMQAGGSSKDNFPKDIPLQRKTEFLNWLHNTSLDKLREEFSNNPLGLSQEEQEEEMRSGGGFKINPKHKGWCTPMSKSTCVGARRQFAINAKHHFKKQQDGGDISIPELPQAQYGWNQPYSNLYDYVPNVGHDYFTGKVPKSADERTIATGFNRSPSGDINIGYRQNPNQLLDPAAMPPNEITGLSPASGINQWQIPQTSLKAQGVGQTLPTNQMSLKKHNDWFTGNPDLWNVGMEAATNVINNLPGGQQWRQNKWLRNTTTSDWWNPLTRGSRGDYDTNSGRFQPQNNTPVQFSGRAGDYSYQKGGSYYMDDNQIKALQDQGYQLDIEE